MKSCTKEDIPSAIHPILKKQTYTCAPYLLLHCVEEGYLMPLAIQFWPNKKKSENPVWTPNDLPNQWLLAKMYFNNANDQVIIFDTRASTGRPRISGPGQSVKPSLSLEDLHQTFSAD